MNCVYQQLFDCQFDCQGFESEELCETLTEMARQCPKCSKGIINPTTSITMDCDKCSFSESFGYFKTLKGYEDLAEHISG